MVALGKRERVRNPPANKGDCRGVRGMSKKPCLMIHSQKPTLLINISLDLVAGSKLGISWIFGGGA